MKKSDYENPEDHIFYCDKFDWYSENELGRRNWNDSKEKIQTFWVNLNKEKLDKADFDFSDFIFPMFADYNPFSNRNELKFNSSVYFDRAKFLGQTAFFNINFDKVVFPDAIFEGSVYFTKCQFKLILAPRGDFRDELQFDKCKFHAVAGFKKSKINGDFSIKECEFAKGLSLLNLDPRRLLISSNSFVNGLFRIHDVKTTDLIFGSSFFENVTIRKLVANKGSLYKIKKQSSFKFSNCTFKEKFTASDSIFKSLIIIESSSENSTKIKDCHFLDSLRLEKNFFYLFDLNNCEINFSSFSSTTFKGESFGIFSSSFNKSTSFASSVFSSDVYITYSYFKDNVDFVDSKFFKSNDISSVFEKEANFAGAQFTGDSYFNSKFYQLADFQDIKIKQQLVFSDSSFEGPMLFSNLSIYSEATLEFSKVKFSSSEISLFQEIEIRGVLVFDHVVFSDMVQFLDCNFNRIIFQKSSIIKATFSSCIFPRSKFSNRIKLWNEDYFYSESHLHIDEMNTYEDIYRQLKLNHIQAKNWGVAGDAYRSEMYIKRKLLINRIIEGEFGLIFNYIIMTIYGIFSGYQQSISKPIIWLIITWLGFAFFMHSYQPQPGFNEAMAKSFVTMFPLSGKIGPTPYADHFYIKLVFERLISVVLLTFFVFSVRARLKQ
ncbi:hypothetical protein [uncultured Croceitalea sp.]|uniref:hypothetical protein n=1 Tax=uncultured Croceitalea sp. TaxID=1798908 RepID=UPI003305AF8D